MYHLQYITFTFVSEKSKVPKSSHLGKITEEHVEYMHGAVAACCGWCTAKGDLLSCTAFSILCTITYLQSKIHVIKVCYNITMLMTNPPKYAFHLDQNIIW